MWVDFWQGLTTSKFTMSRGNNERYNTLGAIRSESMYETGSRRAMARLAKRVGMDLKQTASKVAGMAGFGSVTSAADEWRNDPKYERTLFKDFLSEKIGKRLGDGATIPNSLTVENLGQNDEKGKVNPIPFKTRYEAGFAAAEDVGKGEGKVRKYVDKDGNTIGTEVTNPAIERVLQKRGAVNMLDAVFKQADADRAAGKKFDFFSVVNDIVKEASSDIYGNIPTSRGGKSVKDFIYADKKMTVQQRLERQEKQDRARRQREFDEDNRRRREMGLPEKEGGIDSPPY